MCRLLCLLADVLIIISYVSSRNEKTGRILPAEALAEDGSMRHVISSSERAIRMMPRPVGIVAWFGRSGLVCVFLLRFI